MDREQCVPSAWQRGCKSVATRLLSSTGRAAVLPQPPRADKYKDELAKNWSHDSQSPKLSNNETNSSHSGKGTEAPVLSLNAEFKNPYPFTFLYVVASLNPWVSY